MADQKTPPSAEYSLNNISWHLKRLVEQLEKLNDAMKQRPPSSMDEF